MDPMKEEEMLRKITSHFGIETQLMKFIEEVGEFQNECYKRHFVDPTAGDVEDEAADVLVLFSQLLLYFNVDLDKVGEIFDQKVERTVERIDKNWYDKHR